MGTAASIEGGNRASNKKLAPPPPTDCPAEGVASGSDLLLATKMACLCQLSYTNSALGNQDKESEEKFLKSFHITDFKIWNDITETNDKETGEIISTSIDGQALTGVIANVNEEFMAPIPFVCFRGTKSTSDMVSDVLSVVLIPFKTTKDRVIGTTGLGYEMKYSSFKKLGIIDHLVSLVRQYNTGLLITGHSLGGTVATLFTSEFAEDYYDLFSILPIRLITFGSPRVFDKITSLKFNSFITRMNSMTTTTKKTENVATETEDTQLYESKSVKNFQNLRFSNEKDLVSCLPHWTMEYLYHTGDCYFAMHRSSIWYKIICSNHETYPYHDDDEDEIVVAASSQAGTKGVPTLVMKKPEALFNYAGDSSMNEDGFVAAVTSFAATGANTHMLVTNTGYINQLVHSPVFKETVAGLTDDTVKASFQELPVALDKPLAENEDDKGELIEAAINLVSELGTLLLEEKVFG